MSISEVELLNQKLDILIGDFQAHKKQMHKAISGTLFFIGTTVVIAIVELVR